MSATKWTETPQGIGDGRAIHRTMEIIKREMEELLRNIGFWVHNQCPATGDAIEDCSRCYDEDDEKPLPVGTRPHNQNMPAFIKRLPKRIFEALEGVGIKGKSLTARRVKVNKYPQARH